MRRLIKFVAVIALIAGMVMALAPWTISSRALTGIVADQLKAEFDLDLTVEGRTVIAFLPMPRLKFEEVEISGAGGAPLTRGGELRGQIAVGPLLFGRIVLDQLSLSNALIDIVINKDGRSPWDPVASVMGGKMADDNAPSKIGRVELVNAQIFHYDVRSGSRTIMRNVRMTGIWNNPTAPVEITGSAVIRGETLDLVLTQFNPSRFLAENRSPLELRLSSRLGQLSIVGTASNGTDSPWLIGRSSFETRALRDLLIWSGQSLPLGPLISRFGLEGEISGVGGVVSWPALRVTLGPDRLDGAMTARMENGRLSLNGTLAATTLNLDEFAAPFLESATTAGPWRFKAYDLGSTTKADLDLRVSATSASIHGLRLDDVAMSVLVKKDRIEAGLSRATLNGGAAKGRLTMVRGDDGLELRAQGNAEGVDVAGLMRNMTGGAWMAGRAVGTFSLESRGASAAELARRAQGTADVAVINGQFIGISLDDALRRFERQPLTTSFNLRSGSTPFEEARTSIVLNDGLARLVETGFTTPTLRGVVEGAFFVPDRRISARAAIESRSPTGDASASSALVFDIRGPWSGISVTPDAKALIQRSGAARLLLAPPREAEAAPSGAAPVQ